MVDRMGEVNRIRHVAGATPGRQTAVRPGRAAPQSFAQVLAERLGEVRFSAHATARLASRGIRLDEAQLRKLYEAVDLAAGKGARDALVMVDDVALVVSVVNRTVVTALDRESARAHVFTNIDSAVIT